MKAVGLTAGFAAASVGGAVTESKLNQEQMDDSPSVVVQEVETQRFDSGPMDMGNGTFLYMNADNSGFTVARESEIPDMKMSAFSEEDQVRFEEHQREVEGLESRNEFYDNVQDLIGGYAEEKSRQAENEESRTAMQRFDNSNNYSDSPPDDALDSGPQLSDQEEDLLSGNYSLEDSYSLDSSEESILDSKSVAADESLSHSGGSLSNSEQVGGDSQNSTSTGQSQSQSNSE